LLLARGPVTWRNGFNHCQSLWGRPHVFGQPSRPKDRTQPTKLEIPFGHAFDRREASSSQIAVRARIPSVRDQTVEEHAVLGVSGGGGGHEGVLRDHSFPVASQRFKNAMRKP
jgi:hypothetical protein